MTKPNNDDIRNAIVVLHYLAEHIDNEGAKTIDSRGEDKDSADIVESVNSSLKSIEHVKELLNGWIV